MAKQNSRPTATNKTRDFKMVRFLGFDWVVTNSYKHNATRFYDLVAASHEKIAGHKFKKVPTGTIRLFPEPGVRSNGEPMNFQDYRRSE